MKGTTKKLFFTMLYNKECAKYIEEGWNILYNDILECKGNWETLDEISAYALLDWYEKENSKA